RRGRSLLDRGRHGRDGGQPVQQRQFIVLQPGLRDDVGNPVLYAHGSGQRRIQRQDRADRRRTGPGARGSHSFRQRPRGSGGHGTTEYASLVRRVRKRDGDTKYASRDTSDAIHDRARQIVVSPILEVLMRKTGLSLGLAAAVALSAAPALADTVTIG